MKRGGPLKRSGALARRGKSLKRSSGLAQRKMLARSSTLRARTREPMSTAEKTQQETWYATTIARGCEACAARGEQCEGRLEAHHMIPRSTLKDRGLHELIWHPFNGMCLCYRAHRRHTNRTQPLERRLLRREHFEFAEMFRLNDVLDRLYA